MRMWDNPEYELVIPGRIIMITYFDVSKQHAVYHLGPGFSNI